MGLAILVVTAMYPHPGHEGSGAFVMQQVEQIRSLGHSVDVLHFPGYRSRAQYVKAALEVFRRTRRNHYDVVHAHYGLAGIPALFRKSAPLVVSLHGSDALIGRVQPFISRWVCRRANATIVVSDAIAQRIPGRIIPCGVDLELFKPKGKEQARQKLGLSLQPKYILFPFDPARRVKRYDLAAAAVQRAAKSNVDVELLTISKVHYSEMPWYYSAADAMILCSDSEGSPTAVKECLACNTPVVCTDVGGTLEIVKRIDGVEICDQSEESLAAGVLRVLRRSAETIFDGRSPMQRYSQERTAAQILEVYADAIGSFRRNTVPKEPAAHHSQRNYEISR